MVVGAREDEDGERFNRRRSGEESAVVSKMWPEGDGVMPPIPSPRLDFYVVYVSSWKRKRMIKRVDKTFSSLWAKLKINTSCSIMHSSWLSCWSLRYTRIVIFVFVSIMYEVFFIFLVLLSIIIFVSLFLDLLWSRYMIIVSFFRYHGVFIRYHTNLRGRKCSRLSLYWTPPSYNCMWGVWSDYCEHGVT